MLAVGRIRSAAGHHLLVGVTAATLFGPTLRRACAEEAKPKPAAIASPDGVPVTFCSKSPSTVLYLAHGNIPAHADPDPFERIGFTPVTVKLAPGTYTIETEGPTESTGHQVFVVEHDAPLSVTIHPGDASLRTFGGVLIALGVVTAALGIVAVATFSRDDSGYNRLDIGLPLMLGGAGGTGLGFAMTALGSTDVTAPHHPPGSAQPAALVPTLTFTF